MDDYIQVEDGEDPFYLPVGSNNTLPLETLQSAFPGRGTMYEEVVRGTDLFNTTAWLKWMEADTTSISSHPLFSL